MSVLTPPNPNVATFNNLYWFNPDIALNTKDADKRYLKFPVAQGQEDLKAIVVDGQAQFNANIGIGSITTANNTPILTTNNALMVIGNEGNGRMEIECPFEIGGFGSFNIEGAELSLNSGANINQEDGTQNFINKTTLTTDFGASATPPFNIIDSVSNNNLLFIPNGVAGAYNPASGVGNQTIVASGTFNEEALELTTWSSTNSSVKIAPTSVFLGAGSTTDIPTTSVLCNGVSVAITGIDVEFINTNPPTQSAVQPAPNDSSTKIPTTAWVQTAITGSTPSSILGTNNIFTGTNDFTNTGVGSLASSATQPASNDSSTKIPTTAWVQTAVDAKIPASLLGLNNTWTGTNDFTNTGVGSLASSATQPASNDSSTKIPTTAWVQTAIATQPPAPPPTTLTLDSLLINEGTQVNEPTFGITNKWNTGGYNSFTGVGGSNVVALNNQFIAGQYVKINSFTSFVPPAGVISSLFKINFTFWYNLSGPVNPAWGQTFCYLQLYPNKMILTPPALDTAYNINNNINGDSSWTLGAGSQPLYAPDGRMYWTYGQEFSGISGAQAYLYPDLDAVSIYFRIPSNSYNYECSVECLDASSAIANNYSWKIQALTL